MPRRVRLSRFRESVRHSNVGMPDEVRCEAPCISGRALLARTWRPAYPAG